MAALAASNLGDSTLVVATLGASVFIVTACVEAAVGASTFADATAVAGA